ncbi:sucrase-isomaltase, intestinal-like [Eretmochelys imbricata]
MSLFGNDISSVAMDVEFQTKDRLRFKIYDPNSQRFEVPLKIESPSTAAADTSYDIEFINQPSFQFKIIRKSTGTVLWDTSLGDLIFSRQYLQITTIVPSTSVYGFGEHEHPSFKHNMNFVNYAMFSRDQPPTPFTNLYGVHPFYMCIENDSNTHGILLLNSNAQDITLSPNPSLTFRTIGGILDFYVFLGPTPEYVVQQYTECLFMHSASCPEERSLKNTFSHLVFQFFSVEPKKSMGPGGSENTCAVMTIDGTEKDEVFGSDDFPEP